MDTDLNLLFGVMAMQLEFIDSKQFADACGLWSVDKSRSIAEILCDQKWLNDAERKTVEDLIQRKLKKHGGDPRETLGAEADTRARDFLRDVEDEEIDRTLSFLPPSMAHIRVNEVVDTLDYEPDTRSRYTLTRIHGEGGVGRVWRAHDNRLNRQVALKEIRPERKVSKSCWRRFIKEAQVTGQLEHPNIVPVYEMTSGEKETDETFYTMRFVDGRTLGAEISEYQRQRRDGKANRLHLHRLLLAFCGVCNALAYAHSRGVIHRDLKPANVMLGPFGEVVVLDWGLAKMVDQPEPEDASLDDPPPVSVTEDVKSPQTVDGNVLGTLSYMAPEQAAGRIDLIDRRTDVYGLGAILFALLTGRHPHASKHENTDQIRQRIIHEPSPSAREMEPSVPKALSSICSKAMEKERLNRYASAQDLADEVQRWLGDEPVHNYRESLSERLGRLMRRHRTLTQAVAASLIAIALVMSIAFLIVRDARRDEEIANQDALRRFKEARATVDRTLTSTTDILRYFPGARVLRLRLMEQAALDYEKFVNEDSNDPESRAETARTWVRLGDLRLLLDDEEKANESYLKGEKWLRDLLAVSDNPLSRMELADCLAHRADLYRTQNKIAEARTLLTEALALAEGAEEVPSYRFMEGHVLHKQGLLEQEIGAFEEALLLFQKAIDCFQQIVESMEKAGTQLVADSPGADPQYLEIRNLLAMSRAVKGQVYVEQGRNEKAATVIQTAIFEYEFLVRADEDSIAYLEGLAFSQINLADALSLLSREEEQQLSLGDAILSLNMLLDAIPGAVEFRQSLGIARASLGTSLNRHGYNQGAMEQLEAAFFELNDLYGETQHPDDLHLRSAISVRGAKLHRDMNYDEEALNALTAAIDAYDLELVANYPQNPTYLNGQGAARRQLALLLYKMKKFGEAEAECVLAIKAFDAALKELPGDPYSQDGRANAFKYQADIFRARGEDELAKKKYDEAIAVRDQMPMHPEYRLRLIKLLAKSKAPDNLIRALKLAGELSSDFPLSGEYLTALGAVQYLNDDIATSITTLQAAAKKRLPRNSSREFWLALAHLGRDDLESARTSLELAKGHMDDSAPGKVELIELRQRVEDAMKVVEQP